MLDCYFFEKESGIPEYPDENNYIDSFELDEFRHLERVIERSKEMGITISFFKDFCLEGNEIATFLSLLDDSVRNEKLTEVQKSTHHKMTNVLQKCLASSLDLVCFCD
jgi:hypothetical protein